MKNTRVMRKTMDSLAYHIPVILLSILMIYPLVWMIASSLKENSQIFTQAQNLLVYPLHWENYVRGWRASGRYTYEIFFRNSFFVSFFCTIGSVASSAVVAYGFARIPFRGKRVWFPILMCTMLLPAQVLVIPQYVLFKTLGWINTYLPIIVPQFCSTPFFVFLIMQFMRGVPVELDEAARIDGCGWTRNFIKILLPLSVPALITSAIFAFYWSWQDFFGPLIYLSKPKKYTISIALKMFADPTVATDWSGLFAMSTLSLVPIVVIFICLQKYLVEGVATSGLKG